MEQMSARRLLCVENATKLSTNAIPQTILSEFVIFEDGTKLHQATIGPRPIERDEFTAGRPVLEYRYA